MSDDPRYIVFDRDKPHLVLFQGTLDQVAESIAAQPNASSLRVYASTDGFPRSLRPQEHEQFERAVTHARASSPFSAF